MTTSQASLRVSFKTILFATDFSPSSDAALPYVLSLGRSYDSKVIVAHAVPIEPLPGITPAPSPTEMDLEWQDAKRGMQKYEASREFTGLRHEFVLERGDPLAVVSDLIAHDDVDLMVLGTHGRQGLHKLFAGSVAEQIFRKAMCPVLTVGPGAEFAPPQKWEPHRILLATEFSAGSLHALPYAIALAEENQAELLLMHAVPLVPWEQQAEMAQYYQKRLEELVPDDSSHNCKIDFEVRFDLAVPAILDLAKEKMTDLIVMGVHHTPLPAVDSHVPWTTACEVISNAHCPVLTVRG
jgi:nucleotide-binding universal stress UspA family protein